MTNAQMQAVITAGGAVKYLFDIITRIEDLPSDAQIAADEAAAALARATTESDIVFSDVETLNVSTQQHGLAPKLPGDATKFLDGEGNYTTPAGGADYTKYVALLDQAGTAAPTAVVRENSLGAALTWQRDGAGQYAVSGPAWPSGKTVIFLGPPSGNTHRFIAERADVEFVSVITISLSSGNAADDGLDRTPIEIRIYP